MAQVRLDNITKLFGDFIAVDSIDLLIEDTSFTCLLGPSGCGKTTTLRLISGLEQPSAGKIYFDEHPVQDLPANKRDIAMVFQNYALYPHMSVFNNIGFALRMMHYPSVEIERRVKSAARSLGIEDLLLRKPSELSGGQRQRVAVGRAIVRDSSVFLMDEPLSNLDAQLRFQMRIELKRLHEELRKTFIYVTHDQAEAMTMASKIAVIHKGKLLQYATPDKIYNNPANKFVASFIGSPPINFLSGLLIKQDNQYRIVFGDDYLDYSQDIEIATNDRNVLLGVRPEALSIAPSSYDKGLRAFVVVNEPMGSDLFVVVKLGTGEMMTIRTSPDKYLDSGTNVRVLINDKNIHLFDPDTGRTLL